MLRVKHCFFIFAAVGALTTLIRLRTLNSMGSTGAVWAEAPSLDDAPNTLAEGTGAPVVKNTTSTSLAQNQLVLGPENYWHRTSIVTNSPSSKKYQQRQGDTPSPRDLEKVDIQASTSPMQRQASSAAVEPVRVFEVVSRIIDSHVPALPPTALRAPKDQSDWPLPQLVDVVSAAHHSDGDALLNLALPSMFRSIRHLRYVYIVCSSRMCEMLGERLASNAYDFNTSRVFVVPETSFPFSYNEVKAVRSSPFFSYANGDPKDRTGWTLQQLIKIYIHRVLGPQPSKTPRSASAWPELLPTAVVVDADVVWVRPLSFVEEDAELQGRPRCWYSLASSSSGAFFGDTMYMPDLLERLAVNQKPGCGSLPQKSCQVAETGRIDCGFPFITKEACLGRGCCWSPSQVGHPALAGRTVPWCFMAGRDASADTYTAVTHHTVLQRDVTEDLLQSLEKAYGHQAWQVLAVMQPCLSEYSLYFAWAAHRYPERVAIRFLPYINGGRHMVRNTSDYGLMGSLDVKPPLVYAAVHDDYHDRGQCCVNAQAGDMPCPICQSRTPDMRSFRMPVIAHCRQSFFPRAGKEGREQAACRLSHFVSCLYSERMPEAKSH